MESVQTLSPAPFSWLARAFEVPKKIAIVRLRWPLVIFCSYLLLYSRAGWLNPIMIHGFLILYLLSNAILYLVDERLFSSFYFSTALILFDTLFLTAAMTFSGYLSTDFYLSYFLTVLLCAICKDFRGCIAVAVLAPVVYGSFLFKSAETYDPGVYLRLPFPFVIALFYGYFAQIEHMEKSLEEHKDRAAQQKLAEERTRRNLERIEALHDINSAITSSLDLGAVLEALLEKTALVLPYSAAAVSLWDKASSRLRPVAFRNLEREEWEAHNGKINDGLLKSAMKAMAPLVVTNLQTDPRTVDPDFFRTQGLVAYVGVPLIAKGEPLGMLSFYTKEDHEFTAEEISFLSTVGSQAAIAISNAQLYGGIRDQARELEKADKVKAEFLSLVCHELRTPLNVVMGYTGMIHEGILGEINHDQEVALNKVLSYSGELFAKISDIMQVSMLEAEIIPLRSEEVFLSRFLDGLKRSYDIPRSKGIVMVWDYRPDLPVIWTDGMKLKSILQNLLDNAIKFTAGGHVNLSVRFFPATGSVEFTVTDTGIGIPPAAFPVIFEKFRQADSSETRLYGGMGLGLYIAKKFTDMLGGKIEAKSEPGQGSTFTLTLPY